MSKVVVLHGWGHSTAQWEEFSTMWGEPDMYVFDLPGFGTEPLVDPSWGIPEYAEWCAKRIESLRETEVILIGHSFGGRIAAYLASTQPTWLKALVLYAAPCLYRPSLSTRIKIAFAKVAKTLRLPKYTHAELALADATGLGSVYRRVVPFDQTNRLGLITVPVLLLWGEHDPAVPVAIAQEMHRYIPQSQLVIIENAGHAVHLERPEIFYGTIKNFINSL